VVVSGLKEQAPEMRDTAIATVGKMIGELLREGLPKGAAVSAGRVLISSIAAAMKVDVAFPRDCKEVKGVDVTNR
jgi:hypothetical protein